MTRLTVDLKAQLSWQGVLAAGRDFLAWWRDQLLLLLPEHWRAKLAAVFERWTISLEGPLWRVTPPLGGHDALVLDTALADDELAAAVSRLDTAAAGHRLHATIPPGDGLICRIRLPAAAEQRLRPVVALQLGRLSPFRAEDVRFACRKTSDEGGGEIGVDVAIVPKATLQAYEARLGRIGLSVGRFQFADSPFVFPAVDSRRTRQEQIQLALAAIALAVWLGAILLAPILRSAELDGLTAEIAALRAPAQAAAALRGQLRIMQEPAAAAAAKLAQPSALDTIRLLTELLPNDVQLSDLQIDGSTARISATSRDAGKTVSVLNRSGRFAHAVLRGHPGREADGRARFEVELSLKPAVPQGGGQ